MSTTARRRWHGLVALAFDGLEHGSRAIERVQVETARRVFTILEAIPPTAPAAAIVRVAHDASVAAVHVAIRVTGRALAAVADAALSDRASPQQLGLERLPLRPR